MVRGVRAQAGHPTPHQLDIANPDKVEMCWGMLRPTQLEGCTIKQYIVGVFYCPPNSRKKDKLITHIVTNAHVLMSRYPNSGLWVGGDKNTLNLAPILQGLPRCRQIVSGNTHDDKCLNVLITHSVFAPSDWPIWTNFVGENFRRRLLFFGKSY